MRSANQRSRNFDGELRSQRHDGDVRPDASHAQLLRFMRSKPYESGSMRVEILRLRSDLSVRSGKQQVIGDQCVERPDVGVELRASNSCLELDDLFLGLANEHRGHTRNVYVMHW
jgi:hypothetical protein